MERPRTEAAGASNRFLDRPVKAIDKDSGIGADLTELRRTVEALDPKEATKTRKLLGIVPFGNRVDRYFDKYRSSQTHISKILSSLGNGARGIVTALSSFSTCQAFFASGQLAEFIFVAVSEGTVDANDVTSIAQAAANRIDAAGLGS